MLAGTEEGREKEEEEEGRKKEEGDESERAQRGVFSFGFDRHFVVFADDGFSVWQKIAGCPF
jgi:hypothetical protein